MYRNTNKKIVHLILIITTIFIIVFIVGMFLLKYQVEGETNMPFKLTKISIVQSVEGNEIEGTEDIWNFNVNENNDIYIYIEKNSGYGKTEIIDTVKIDNIRINKENNIGETKIYKPTEDEKRMFINSSENEITEITYSGDLESNIKEQKISNQGGIAAFRYSINNLSQYISNSNNEIDHSKLLQLTNIKEEDIKAIITFNITITLTTKRQYQAEVSINIPAKEIIENGTNGIEITDFGNVVFKRIEN